MHFGKTWVAKGGFADFLVSDAQFDRGKRLDTDAHE